MSGAVYDPAVYEAEKGTSVRSASGAQHLAKLSGKHYKIIAFHMAGMKGSDIAAQLGMTPGRISNILNDPLVKEAIKNRFRELDMELDVRAVEVVREGLEASAERKGPDGCYETVPDHVIRLKAADMVWKARGRYQLKETSTTITAEDVVARMLEIAKDRGSAEVTIRADVPQQDYLKIRDPVLALEGMTD